MTERDIPNEVAEDETPIFTEADVYRIVGFVFGCAEDFDEDDDLAPEVVLAIDLAIQVVLRGDDVEA